MSNVSSLRDTDTGLPLLRKRPYDEVTFTADFSLRIGSDATVTTVNQASARALGRIDNAANLTVTNPIVRSGSPGSCHLYRRHIRRDLCN